MVNSLYTAIAIRLEELFGKPVIYFDKLPQGFRGPCFFVKLLNAKQELKIHNRYEVSLSYDVHYFPTGHKDYVAEINNAAYKMLFGLEYVNRDGFLTRGTDMSYEVQEDVLHFFVTYRFFVLMKTEAGQLMEKLYQQYKYKE